jgi:hypothetical protein
MLTSIAWLCLWLRVANSFLTTDPYVVSNHHARKQVCARSAGMLQPTFASTPPQSEMSLDENEYEGEGEDADADEGGYSFDEQQQKILDETYKLNLQIAQYARASSVRNKTAAWTAHDILRNKQQYPDTVAYNSVLNAFAKSSSLWNKQVAHVAQELLEEMQQLHKVQVKQNQEWYRRLDYCEDGNNRDDIRSENQQNSDDVEATLKPLTQDELSAGPPRIRVKPNVRSFSTVMDAWGKQGNPAAAQKAEDLLYELEDLYEDRGDVSLQPNSISYNTVITAWAKSGARREGAEKAQALLDEMVRHSFADVISYNAVLHAWARSGLPDAGKRAENILRTMNDVLPNSRTYTTVMDAWGRSYGCPDSARRALALLAELEAQRQSRPTNNMLKPNCVTYSTVIHALALSKTEPLKAHKAFGLLQRMHRLSKEDPNVRPNRVTYNSVLNACATSCPRAVEKSLEEQGMSSNLPSLPSMVRTIYEQLLKIDEKQQPDHFTFGTVLKAVANLFWGEPDQVEFGKHVFVEACSRGHVSFGVLSQLREALPADVYRELLPPEAISPERSEPLMNHIPKEWTRNMQEDKSRRRLADTNYASGRNSTNTSTSIG